MKSIQPFSGSHGKKAFGQCGQVDMQISYNVTLNGHKRTGKVKVNGL